MQIGDMFVATDRRRGYLHVDRMTSVAGQERENFNGAARQKQHLLPLNGGSLPYLGTAASSLGAAEGFCTRIRSQQGPPGPFTLFAILEPHFFLRALTQ
jgi:hypothetical protein